MVGFQTRFYDRYPDPLPKTIFDLLRGDNSSNTSIRQKSLQSPGFENSLSDTRLYLWISGPSRTGTFLSI